MAARFFARSIWRAETAAHFRDRFRSPRNIGSQRSTGAWSPEKRKPIFPGIRGNNPTPTASRRCGFTKFFAPAALHIARKKSILFAQSQRTTSESTLVGSPCFVTAHVESRSGSVHWQYIGTIALDSANCDDRTASAVSGRTRHRAPACGARANLPPVYGGLRFWALLSI